MPQPKLPLQGGCRCGQVRFRVSAPPLLTGVCHCTGCQKMASSAFSLSVAFPSAGFEITAGEPVIGGLHGDDVHHYFCPHCMTWMFTRPTGMDAFVNVRATMLDDPAWVTPFMETYTSEKLPWATVPAARSFERFPPMDAFQDLIEAYAKQA
jgi:hypothetical protein